MSNNVLGFSSTNSKLNPLLSYHDMLATAVVNVHDHHRNLNLVERYQILVLKFVRNGVVQKLVLHIMFDSPYIWNWPGPTYLQVNTVSVQCAPEWILRNINCKFYNLSLITFHENCLTVICFTFLRQVIQTLVLMLQYAIYLHYILFIHLEHMLLAEKCQLIVT